MSMAPSSSDGAPAALTPRPLVVGYGNSLRRDDGVGVRAAEWLAADPRLTDADVLAVHQLTPELALDVGAASLLVLIDADVTAAAGVVSVATREPWSAGAPSGSGAPPGPGAPSGSGGSSHHVGAAEILALARELVGHAPPAVTVSVGVADMEMGEGLSPEVEAALPDVAEAVARLVSDARSG